jgi:hypothetical protein
LTASRLENLIQHRGESRLPVKEVVKRGVS